MANNENPISGEMTSRERVIIAAGHEEPDRVPVDFGSMGSTGITALAYTQLKRYLGMEKGTIRVYDTGQQLAEPEQAILDLLGVDVLDLKRSLPPAGPNGGKWKRWKLRDETRVEVPANFNPEPAPGGGYVKRNKEGRIVARMPEDGFYFDGVYHPLEDMKNTSEIKDIDWEGMKISDDAVQHLKRKAKYLHRETDYALHLMGLGGVHEWGQGLRGWKNWLFDVTKRRNITEALLDRMMEVNMDKVKKLVKAVGNHVQILGFGDDLGMQMGPQISPETYREVLKPCHEEMFTYVKKHTDCFTFLHSCGSIYDLLPDIVDAGLDIINPVQISAARMDPDNLKKEFGEQLTFWGGGADTQNVLGYEPVDVVRRHVKDNISVFAEGGGFVFNQVHNVQPNVSPESLIAAYSTAREYGEYPLTQ